MPTYIIFIIRLIVVLRTYNESYKLDDQVYLYLYLHRMRFRLKEYVYFLFQVEIYIYFVNFPLPIYIDSLFIKDMISYRA